MINQRIGILVFLLFAAGCGHVAGNFPQSLPAHESWIKGKETARLVGPGFELEVGPASDIRKRTARRDAILKDMARGAGQKQVDAMVSDGARQYPFIHRLYNESGDCVFYRGTVSMEEGRTFPFNEGDLLLTFISNGDTLQSRDEGVVFIKHKASDLSLFTNDGRVLFSNKFNGTRPGEPNRIYIKSPIQGKIIQVELAISN